MNVREELLANWDIAMNSELPFKIEPLKQGGLYVFSCKRCKDN